MDSTDNSLDEYDDIEVDMDFAAKGLDPEASRDYDMSDVRFQVGSAGPRYRLGERCTVTTDQGENSKIVQLASRVWPVEFYTDVDENERGVRLLYRPFPGANIETALCPQGAFTSKSEARREASRLASKGVSIYADQGDEFVMALGHWLHEVEGVEHVKLTHSPGWHDSCQVYCNGEHVFAPDEETWYSDTSTNLIARRSTRCGSAIEWVNKVASLACTPGLRVALGVSLAGPLVDLIHPSTFLVHFYGPSSSGKSTALQIGGSVWGHPEKIRNSWNNTVNALEGLACIADGACLLLDELGQFSGHDEKFEQAIYNLTSEQGRNRAQRSGDLREQKHWSLTGISTGEIAMKDRVGAAHKGGQDVRMIDLPIRPGDLTTGADHADTIKSAIGLDATGGHYGRVGDQWVRWLQQHQPIVDAAKIRDSLHESLKEEIGHSAESSRMLKHCALVGSALELAGEVKLGRQTIVPWNAEKSREAVLWMARKCVQQRTEETPNERALALLWQRAQAYPSRFPQEKTVERDRVSGQIWGLRDKQGDVFLSEKLLKASGLPRKAGVGVRSFLKWAVDEGHAEKTGRQSRAGYRCRWYRFSQ